MQKLKITLVQSKIYWEDVSKNINHFTTLLGSIKKGSTDLIVLPEMFTTGFSMHAAEFAEDVNGSALLWMRQMAAKKKTVLCGSIMFTEKNKFFNRFIWMRPDGTFEQYDKRHLFSFGKEDQTYTSGKQKLIVDLKGFKICPMICYDLRFPVWSKNKATVENGKLIADYDVLLYVANWPQRRRQAWKQLLIARAIENVCYVVGLNRVGKDTNGLQHTGDSGMIDFLGNAILKIKPLTQAVKTVAITKNDLQNFRNNFQVLADADNFSIQMPSSSKP